MGPSLTAMGFTTHLHGMYPPLIYAQPSGLTATWHLKYTVTIQTPHKNTHKHVSNIIVGIVLNLQPFLHTWVSCLLGITSCAQIACLLGNSWPSALRVLHSVVPRIFGCTPWDVGSTLQCSSV